MSPLKSSFLLQLPPWEPYIMFCRHPKLNICQSKVLICTPHIPPAIPAAQPPTWGHTRPLPSHNPTSESHLKSIVIVVEVKYDKCIHTARKIDRYLCNMYADTPKTKLHFLRTKTKVATHWTFAISMHSPEYEMLIWAAKNFKRMRIF